MAVNILRKKKVELFLLENFQRPVKIFLFSMFSIEVDCINETILTIGYI